MTHSMTAFAREEAHGDHFNLYWEIRSVNHRYLDSSFKMPEEFRHLEYELQKLLKAKISRGKIDATLKVETIQQGHHSLSINQSLVQSLAGTLDELKTLLPLSDKLSPMDVLKWPGVIEVTSKGADEANTAIVSAFKTALESLASMRKVEGENLKSFILQRVQEIESHVKNAQDSVPIITRHLENKVRSRLEEFDTNLDQGRIEQEIVFLVQKADVQEEIDRLSSHLAEIRSTFKMQKPIGRRLDFLMQELNREANTLSSKSAHADSSLQAVEIKVLIEQIREQVQNLE